MVVVLLSCWLVPHVGAISIERSVEALSHALVFILLQVQFLSPINGALIPRLRKARCHYLGIQSVGHDLIFLSRQNSVRSTVGFLIEEIELEGALHATPTGSS